MSQKCEQFSYGTFGGYLGDFWSPYVKLFGLKLLLEVQLTKRACVYMVVQARMDYIRARIAEGCQVHIASSFSAQSGRDKVRFIIDQVTNIVPLMSQAMTLRILDTVTSLSDAAVTMDRGHNHSDGKCEICLGMTSLSSEPSSLSQRSIARPSLSNMSTSVPSTLRTGPVAGPSYSNASTSMPCTYARVR